MKATAIAYILIYTFLFCGAAVKAQPSKDSALFKMATNAFTLASKNADSAIQLSKKALQLAQAINHSEAKANASNSLGWAFMHKGNFDSAIYYLLQARQLFLKVNHKTNLIKVNINLAEVYNKQSRFANAIHYLVKADSLSTIVNDSSLQADIKRQLGIVYRESGDPNKAAQYFTMAMRSFLNLKDFRRYTNTAISLSILFRNTQRNDSSLAILNNSLQIAKEKNIGLYEQAMIYENLGETFFNMQQYQGALKNYALAYKSFERLNHKADMAYEALCLGKTYAKLNNPVMAEKYLLAGFHLNDSLNMLNYHLETALALAQFYNQTGKWENAYRFLLKAHELQDSINTSAELMKTNELKAKFEAEKKDHEISLLKAQRALSLANIKRTRLLQYLFIILFAASVAIGWLLYNRLKIKRRLKEQTIRNQIASDLHDDIGSALSSIDISSRVALSKEKEDSALNPYLIRIRQQARKTLENMSDIVWSVNSEYDNVAGMLARMKEFASDLCEPKNIQVQFQSTVNEQLTLESSKRKNLYLIFKEAINNAVKYSYCNTISIQFSKNEEVLQLYIADNGQGFDMETIKKGNGLKNITERANTLGGTISILSTKEKGTQLNLQCPV